MEYPLWDNGTRVERESRTLYHVGVRAVAKPFDGEHRRWEFVNEFIGFRLGSLLGLPVVPGLLATRDGERCYCSFNFNTVAPEQLPSRANVRNLVTKHENLANGIVLFDSWILNEDRHDRNIGYYEDAGSVHLIDHGESLLRGADPLARMARYCGDPALGSGVIKEHLASLRHLWAWWERLCSIPVAAIRGVLETAAREWGMPPNLTEPCTTYLDERRRVLPLLIEGNRHLFTRLEPNPMAFRDPWFRTVREQVEFDLLAAWGLEEI